MQGNTLSNSSSSSSYYYVHLAHDVKTAVLEDKNIAILHTKPKSIIIFFLIGSKTIETGGSQ